MSLVSDACSSGGGGSSLVAGPSGRGFGPVFLGLVFVLFRPHRRRFRLLLFRFLRLAFAAVSFLLFCFSLGVGSYRGCGGCSSAFLVSRLVLGLRCCGVFVFVFSYSGAPYIARSFKLSMF